MSHTIITRLSQRERFLLEKGLVKGKKIAKIAYELGRHRSTIYREINRNTPNRYNYTQVTEESQISPRGNMRFFHHLSIY